MSYVQVLGGPGIQRVNVYKLTTLVRLMIEKRTIAIDLFLTEALIANAIEDNVIAPSDRMSRNIKNLSAAATKPVQVCKPSSYM